MIGIDEYVIITSEFVSLIACFHLSILAHLSVGRCLTNILFIKAAEQESANLGSSLDSFDKIVPR